MISKKNTLKEILNGTITKDQARQELRKASKPFPTLIKWSSNEYSLWPDSGHLTEEQVKLELGVNNLDGIVIISFQ